MFEMIYRMADFLKGQVNVINILIIASLLAFWFYRVNRKTLGKLLITFCIIFFVLSSTGFIPRYLVSRLESQYPVFLDTDSISFAYVVVLGGGFTDDERLPVNSQLSSSSLGRLVEGIRVSQLLDSSRLICSGYAAHGNRSLASVMKETAIILGMDSTRIEVLDQTHSTQEEAESLLLKFGSVSPVVIVTDALHIPRAIKFFGDLGIPCLAAPTNFQVKNASDNHFWGWVPSGDNIQLTNQVIRECLGNLKALLFG